MVAPEEAARPEPQWPATPAWRANARNTDAPTTLAGRTLLPQPDATDLWAASAREVLSAPPGHRCGRVGHAPAVRPVRAVAVGQRPVLPPLRHPPGLGRSHLARVGAGA